MTFLEVNLDGLIQMLVLIMFGPAVVLAIIGGILRYNNKRKAAKVFFILAVVYVVISLGICGGLMAS